jgi:CRP-like cAMP-binding protein
VVDGILALRNVSPLLRTRIRDYYQRFMAGVNLESKEEEFLGKLSQPLATDSTVLMTRHIFKMCHHLQAIDEAFIAQHDIQLEHVQFAEGEDVITEGEDTNDVYILASGAVTVHEWNGDVVTTLRSGAIFGEMAAILGTNTRQATVRSAMVTEVYVIPAELLYLMMRTFPAIEADMVSIVKARHLHLTTSILLPLLPDAELENIFNLADSAVSNRLSHHQLFAVLRMMNRTVNEQQFGRFLEIVDPETTGFVTFRDFMKVFGLAEIMFDAWWEPDSVDKSADRFNFRSALAQVDESVGVESGYNFEPKPYSAVSAALAAHSSALAAHSAELAAHSADPHAHNAAIVSLAAPRRGSIIERRQSMAEQGALPLNEATVDAAVPTIAKSRRDLVEERVSAARARTPHEPSPRDSRPNRAARPQAGTPAPGGLSRSRAAEVEEDAFMADADRCQQQWQQEVSRQLQPSRFARARSQMSRAARKLLGSAATSERQSAHRLTHSDDGEFDSDFRPSLLQSENTDSDPLGDGLVRRAAARAGQAPPTPNLPAAHTPASHAPGALPGRIGDSLDSSVLTSKFRDILESGSKLDKTQRRLRNTTEDASKYESARQIFSEMQKFRQTDIVKKVAFIIQCQQELDAITPELVSQVCGFSAD